jgi:hypothetical protein
MAQTAAERQAAYRARKLSSRTEEGHAMTQLTLIVSAAHRALLSKAAQRHGVTQAEILAKIIETSPLVRDLEQERDDFLSGRMSGTDSKSA